MAEDFSGYSLDQLRAMQQQLLEQQQGGAPRWRVGFDDPTAGSTAGGVSTLTTPAALAPLPVGETSWIPQAMAPGAASPAAGGRPTTPGMVDPSQMPLGDLYRELGQLQQMQQAGQAEQPPQPQSGPQWLPGPAAARQAAAGGATTPAAAVEQFLAPTAPPTGKRLIGTGIETAATVGGALAGAATGPLAPIATPVLAGVASYGAHQLNKALGLLPGEPTLVPQDLGDVLALGGPMVPDIVRGGLRYSRAGRALRTAERETASLEEARQGEVAAREAGNLANEQALNRAERMPETYQPTMPPRSVYDVRRDLDVLNQGGPAAKAVMDRLGVTTPEEATTQLMNEGQTYLAGGQAWPGRSQPQRVTTPPAGGVPELQKFIEQQGGIKLTGETLPANWFEVMGPKEVGKQGPFSMLVNDQTGKSLQDLATAAHQAGYITEPTLEGLRQGLSESIFRERPVYPAQTPPTTTVTRLVGDKPAANVVDRLYDRFRDIAGGKPVNTAPAEETLAKWGDKLKEMPQLQQLVGRLRGFGDTPQAGQVEAVMRDIGKLTRRGDAKTQESAKELWLALHESMEKSLPEQLPLLQQAKSAWMQREAADKLGDLLRRGGPIIRQRGGAWEINPDALANTVSKSPLLERFLPPEEYARLQADVAAYAQVPRRQGMPPAVTPVEPKLAPPSLRRLATEFGAGMLAKPGLKVGAALALGDAGSYALAKVLLSPQVRPVFSRWIRAGGGAMPPELYGALGAGIAEWNARNQEEGGPR